jgi:hypothetical protein
MQIQKLYNRKVKPRLKLLKWKRGRKELIFQKIPTIRGSGRRCKLLKLSFGVS